MLKYVLSLFFGVILGSLFLSYIKYKNTTEKFTKFEKQEANYKTEINQSKKENLSQDKTNNIEKLKSEIATLQNEKTKNEIELNKFRDMYLNTLDVVKISEPTLINLIQRYKNLPINHMEKKLPLPLYNLIKCRLLYLFYVYDKLKDLPLEYLDRPRILWDSKEVTPLKIWQEIDYILYICRDATIETMQQLQKQGIFPKHSDIITISIINPIQWRIFNKFFFTDLPITDKIKIINLAKKVNLEPKKYEFASRIKINLPLYYFIKKILQIETFQNIKNMEFKLYIFIKAIYPIISYYEYIAPIYINELELINRVKNYYANLYALDNEQLLKITPYIRTFLSSVKDNLVKKITTEFTIKQLQSIYVEATNLYYIVKEQIILEEKIKQFLNYTQLYKVSNRIIESVPLYFSR